MLYYLTFSIIHVPEYSTLLKLYKGIKIVFPHI